MVILPNTEEARTLRRDLASSLTEWATTDDSAGSTFRTVVWPASSLVGPPGRLHGGLHPAVRLLLPLARFAGEGILVRERLTMRLRMRKAILLEAPTVLEGRHHHERDGSHRVQSGSPGSPRLDATLVTGAPDDDEAVLERFRRRLAEDAGASDRNRIVGHGALPVGVGPGLVKLRVDHVFATDADIGMTRFLLDGPAIDPVFICAALDVAGAYALGMNLDCRLFTTDLAVSVRGGTRIEGEGVLVLGSREAERVEDSDLAPVSVRGELIGEQRVEVLVADPGLERAFGHGLVSLVPVRD